MVVCSFREPALIFLANAEKLDIVERLLVVGANPNYRIIKQDRKSSSNIDTFFHSQNYARRSIFIAFV